MSGWSVFIDEAGNFASDESVVVCATVVRAGSNIASQRLVDDLRAQLPHVPWPYHAHLLLHGGYHVICYDRDKARAYAPRTCDYLHALEVLRGEPRRAAVARLRDAVMAEVRQAACEIPRDEAEDLGRTTAATVRQTIAAALAPRDLLLFAAAETEPPSGRSGAPMSAARADKRYESLLYALLRRVLRALSIDAVKSSEKATPQDVTVTVADHRFGPEAKHWGQPQLERFIRSRFSSVVPTLRLHARCTSYYAHEHEDVGMFLADLYAGRARDVVLGADQTNKSITQTEDTLASLLPRGVALSTSAAKKRRISHLAADGDALDIEERRRALRRWATEQALEARWK